MMQEMVLGFAFNADKSQIALILRNRLAWQAGCYNGIGGHIETGEHPIQAMVREFREETGCQACGWQLVLVMHRDHEDPRFRCYVYRAILAVRHLQQIVRTAEDQAVHVYPTAHLPANVLPNLRWLVPLLADTDAADGAPYEFEGRITGVKFGRVLAPEEQPGGDQEIVGSGLDPKRKKHSPRPPRHGRQARSPR